MLPIRVILAALLACVAATVGAEEIVRLATRDGVTQPYLLDAPAGRPLAAVVLFPGGDGAIPAPSISARMKRSIAVRGQAVSRTAGGSTLPNGWKAQCSRARAARGSGRSCPAGQTAP